MIFPAGILTFFFFPMLVGLAFAADKGRAPWILGGKALFLGGKDKLIIV